MPHPNQFRSIDILLVESDPKLADLVQQAILKACPTCFLKRVARASEAESFFREEGGEGRRLNPSLVLIDLHDPRDGGARELMEWLRGHARTKHVPIVVLGAVEDPESVRRAYDLGASSYLVKPREEARLIEMVSAVASYWTAFNHPPD